MSTTTRTPPARVSALRTLSIVLAFAAALGLIFGTAGFTAMEADRGLDVNVTDDESAYLGYEPLADEVHDGESTPVVEYRNQFGVDLTEFDVDVSIADPGTMDATIQSVDPPSSLGEGNATPVNVTLDCDAETTVPLEFAVNGSGGGVSVSFERTHTVTCVPKDPLVTGVTFNDAANGNITVQGADGKIDANLWLADNPPKKSVDTLTEVRFNGAGRLDTSEKVRQQVEEKPRNWKIVAIELPDQNVTFLHPGWNAGVYETPSSADGVAYHGTVDEAFLLNASVENRDVVVGSAAGD